MRSACPTEHLTCPREMNPSIQAPLFPGEQVFDGIGSWDDCLSCCRFEVPVAVHPNLKMNGINRIFWQSARDRRLSWLKHRVLVCTCRY
jgi:hypothetical protein